MIRSRFWKNALEENEVVVMDWSTHGNIIIIIQKGANGGSIVCLFVITVLWVSRVIVIKIFLPPLFLPSHFIQRCHNESSHWRQRQLNSWSLMIPLFMTCREGPSWSSSSEGGIDSRSHLLFISSVASYATLRNFNLNCLIFFCFFFVSFWLSFSCWWDSDHKEWLR